MQHDVIYSEKCPVAATSGARSTERVVWVSPPGCPGRAHETGCLFLTLKAIPVAGSEYLGSTAPNGAELCD
jgi:hypothetical protein